MPSDFSRTLALLRKEKKISQRTAAADLGVSQALLSHYENGLREPGLGFVVRAADYYSVSCDYLLGRSMARDGSAVSPVRVRDVAAESNEAEPESITGAHRRLIVNSVALLFDLVEQAGSVQLSAEMMGYLSLVIYKVFRYLYMADPDNVEAAFRTPPAHFDGLCNAQMSLFELRIRAAARGEDTFGLHGEEVHLPSLSPVDIARNFPGLSQSLLTLLQAVGDMISPAEHDRRGADKRRGEAN